MNNEKPKDQLILSESIGIEAPEDLVRELLSELTYNRPHYQHFLETVDSKAAFIFCAWFVAQWAAQDPQIIKDFAEALKAATQVAGDMLVQHAKQNPDFVLGAGDLLVLYPTGGSGVVNLDPQDDSTGFVQ